MLLSALLLAASSSAPQVDAGALDVAILDAEGAILLEGWSFSIARKQPDRGLRQHHLRSVGAQIDPDAGAARIEGLSPGTYWLRADHVVGRRLDPVEVIVEAGGVRPILLRDEGPPIDESLAVRLLPVPRTLELRSGDVYVVRAGSEDLSTRRPLVWTGSERATWSSVSLESGLYEVVIDHPALIDWRSKPVPTGHWSRVVIESRATVELAVTDRASGAPVPRYSGFSEPYGERFTGPGEAASGRAPGTIEVVTGHSSLVVTAWGYAASEVPFEDLRLGEHRRVSVALDALASMSVTAARGQSLELEWLWPLAGSQVRPPSGLEFGVQPSGRIESARVAPGRYRLIERGPFVRESEGRAKAPTRVEIELLPGETLEVDLGAASQVRPEPGGEPPDGLREREGLR